MWLVASKFSHELDTCIAREYVAFRCRADYNLDVRVWEDCTLHLWLIFLVVRVMGHLTGAIETAF